MIARTLGATILGATLVFGSTVSAHAQQTVTPENFIRAETDRMTYPVPENTDFWSITVYGDDGYIKSEASTIRSVNATLNDDGTFTAYFGSKELCGDVPNRVDTPDGWNFLMRI